MSTLRSAEEALAWLSAEGAHPWLVRHHELVVEAAGELIDGLASLAVRLDREHVLIGAALHDAGKILHPREMAQPGHDHEESGEAMLLAAGLDAHIARACVTHAAWSHPSATIEDRLIALADKLWKGKRDDELERAVIEELAASSGRPAWAIFETFDALCEQIAEAGPARLARSAS